MSSQPVIHVAAIRKTYGALVAVDDISLDVWQGEIFGLIGPNAAGKTTTMECVEGLRTPDRGAISVPGLDPRRDIYALQNRIGVQLQEAQLQSGSRCATRWASGRRSTGRRSTWSRCSTSWVSVTRATRGS